MKADSIVAVSQLANPNLCFHIGLFPTRPLIPLPPCKRLAFRYIRLLARIANI